MPKNQSKSKTDVNKDQNPKISSPNKSSQKRESTPTTPMDFGINAIALLPFKAAATNLKDIEPNISDPLENATRPLIGLYFDTFYGNYSYTMTFHSYLTHTHSDPWKQ